MTTGERATPAGDYEHDVFVSYPRRGDLPRWVGRVLVPYLQVCLDECLDAPAEIAFDQTCLDTGQDWPVELSELHYRSRVFLVILAYPYFTSGWCASEWRNAVARIPQSDSPPRLVVPLRYNDMSDDHLNRLSERQRDEVRRYMYGDFGRFSTLVNPLADTRKADDFRTEVKALAEHVLKPAIENAPPFREDWPRLPHEPWLGSDRRWKSRLVR